VGSSPTIATLEDIMSDTIKFVKVVNEFNGNGFQAWINGDSTLWGRGDTWHEAVTDALMNVIKVEFDEPALERVRSRLNCTK
jgi:hypothetical protein